MANCSEIQGRLRQRTLCKYLTYDFAVALFPLSGGEAFQKRRCRSLPIFSESETLNFESANRKFADLQDRHGRRFLKVSRISGVELEARKSRRRRCEALMTGCRYVARARMAKATRNASPQRPISQNNFFKSPNGLRMQATQTL
jgi:hypothetical protein